MRLKLLVVLNWKIRGAAGRAWDGLFAELDDCVAGLCQVLDGLA